MLQRLLCFLRFHNDLQTDRVYLRRSINPPTVSYADIPADAQVRRVVKFTYFVDLWEDHTHCLSCKREVSKVQDWTSDTLTYNEMIYLADGRPYIAHPTLTMG